MTADEIAILIDADRAAARQPLDRALKALHGSGRSHELCTLHRLAAEYWDDDPAQAAFHRTHAYIYALEAGDTGAEAALFQILQEQRRI